MGFSRSIKESGRSVRSWATLLLALLPPSQRSQVGWLGSAGVGGHGCLYLCRVEWMGLQRSFHRHCKEVQQQGVEAFAQNTCCPWLSCTNAPPAAAPCSSTPTA